MEKEYKDFVEELIQALVAATGYEEKRIYFKKKDDYPPSSGDRIFVEFAAGQDYREVTGLFVENLYQRYCKGTAMEEIVQYTLNDLERIKASGTLRKAQNLADYEKIKGDLFIRPLNLERNREELKNSIYREIGDIALVLYVRMGSCNGLVTSFKVRRDMVETLWHQDCEEVFEEALKNTYSLTPPRIFRLEKLVLEKDYTGDDFMDGQPCSSLSENYFGNCLSTEEHINGAVSVFLPGVAERLGELMGSGYYIAFTSIHEAMIHSENSADPERLKTVLKDTVEDATPKEDILSLNIYYYDKDSGMISMVHTAEQEEM